MSVVLSLLVCGDVLWQPQETATAREEPGVASRFRGARCCHVLHWGSLALGGGGPRTES